MIRSTVPAPESAPRRPVDETYWVVPGRLLVGAHPGSRSRAQAMDRLRRFLEAGVTCFIDLTEPEETAAYESLLPFETPTGRRIEYLREPIVDHGVPAGRETMARILAMLDGALESGHTVYLHCRAGIGRSAMAAACWLAERAGSGERALAELDQAWSQAAQSRYWPRVPETDEQLQFVLGWVPVGRGIAPVAARAAVLPEATGTTSFEQRLAGAWYGLALGDAIGAHRASRAGSGDTSAPLAWTQHTALSLCLAGSLLDKSRCDPRDQIERYVRWQREGRGSTTGTPAGGVASPDVARALATYLWRGLPMAGSHDPRDVAATSLPRVLAAASFAWREPATAVALGAECSRTTHQSPLILDACRLYAAILVCALQGTPPAAWLTGVPDFQPSPWSAKPLQKDVLAAAAGDAVEPAAPTGSALHALVEARRIVREAADFEAAIEAASRAGRGEAPLYAALVGTLFGAMHGLDALPAAARARLAGASQIDDVLSRWLERGRASSGVTA